MRHLTELFGAPRNFFLVKTTLLKERFHPRDESINTQDVRRKIGALQALRLALFQHMFIRAVSIPQFSRANDVSRDDVILFEVMVESVDRDWWTQYRGRLEQRFAQDEILVRTMPVERI